MKRVVFLFFVSLGPISLGARNVFAEDKTSQCASPAEVKLEESLASASAIAHFRGSEDSISKRSLAMINNAMKNDSANVCPVGCAPTGKEIVFLTVPNIIKRSYDEAAECEALLTATTRTPIVYPATTFNSAAELSSWLAELSQGKGKDGEDLYRKCPGSCSPQYRCIITPQGNKLRAYTEVICGHARDKWDNNFKLTSILRTTCSQTQESAQAEVTSKKGS